MFIRSERLFLRPAFPEDCGAILAGIGEEGIVRNFARAPWPYGIADEQAFAAMPQDQRLPQVLSHEEVDRLLDAARDKGRSIEDLKTTIVFGMWSIIPYFVYLATLYVMVDKMRLEASLAVAAVAWLMAATVLVSVWVRVHA